VGAWAAGQLLGDGCVEPAHREIVEKEQRLSAPHGDVVDAHGDAINAAGVVAAQRECDLQFRADAIGPRDEHGIGIAVMRRREGHPLLPLSAAGVEYHRVARHSGENVAG